MALGSDVHDNSTKNASQKVKKCPANNSVNDKTSSGNANNDSQKVKANGEKLSQPKSGVCTMKVNGEGLIPNSNDSKPDKISTKEPIVNGTDKKDTIVNGDPKKELDCDISSSDNTKVVSNGINSDSNDTKTNKSEEKVEVIKQVCPIKPEGKQISENKKEKKTKTADKTNDTEKKKDSAKDKNADGKKEKKDDGTVHKADAGDKVNGECSKTLNGEGDRESSPSEDGDEKKRDAEVVFIQDMGFTVKIVSPGAEPLDIQVSSMELVQEIHQVLMDREDSCHRTCFSLQLDGVTLDNFAELKNIEGLKEGSVIKVVEEPYTMREARIHVRHVRDLLKSIDYTDAYAGQECSSLAFLNIITQGDILEKKKSRPESVDCTPPDYIMPGSTERPLLPLHPGLTKENKAPQCLKVLTTSGWNPPPGPRKMCGDLLYLHVVTLEDRHFHITACPRGFYLNQSTEEVFNPRPATPSLLCHSLIELLSIVSPAFKRNFALVQKKRMQKHPFERVATPYQVYQWASPMLDHTVDAIRAEDTFSSKLGYEEHIPGQTRDWNEELQTTRELPRSTLPERLLRERAIFKVHSDFVAAATRGAMAVVDGNVMAINPGEEPKMQMFIWNNIFFSLGFDVRDHYKDLGGDAAAFVAPRNDLQGVRVYSAVDTAGLHTLGTVVVDYRGYRVTAQSIIPGILEKEQEQSVVYGSIDFGTTVLSHPKYMELLSKAGQQLKIMPHSVISANGETVELCSSVECKGIIGNDGRHYILDLLRTFPPDVNFLQLEDDELREDIKSMGFPIIHKHKLCCLRQELVDSFVEARYFMFIRYAAFHLQQLSAKRQRDTAQKSIENKDIDMKEAANETEKIEEKTKRETKSQEKEVKEKKHKKEDKKEKESAKKEAAKEKTAEEEKPAAKSEKKEDDLLLNENYSEIDTDVAKKIVESITDSICSGGDKQESDSGERSRAVVAAAARAVASLKESEFDVRFNPDVYSAGIKHAAEPEQLAKQRHLVKEAAAFLLTTQIPAFVRECLEHTSAPMDGAGLTEALHGRGINVRYLGRVANALRPHAQLSYLHAIAVAELLLRAAKHIYTAYLQGCEAMCIGAAVAHFLNCLLGACGSPALSAAEGPGAARPTRMMSGMGPNGPMGPMGPCGMKGIRGPCGGPDMKSGMCTDMHMGRGCGGPMGRMPNPMGGMGGPKPCMMGGPHMGPRMMPGPNLNAMNVPRLPGGIMMDGSMMGGMVPHGDCGPDHHGMPVNGPMCDEYGRGRNMGPGDPGGLGPGVHKAGLRSPKSPASADIDWQKIQHQFFDDPKSMDNDMSTQVKSPCSERGGCLPPPPYGTSPLHRSASVPIDDRYSRSAATQSPGHGSVQMPMSAEASRAGSGLNSPAHCKPGPKNDAPGQELTIQKQPNTSLKDNGPPSNSGGQTPQSNSNQKSPAGMMPGTPEPHGSLSEARAGRFSLEQSPGFNNPQTPTSAANTKCQDEKSRPSPQSNRSSQDSASKTPQRDTPNLSQGPYAPTSSSSSCAGSVKNSCSVASSGSVTTASGSMDDSMAGNNETTLSGGPNSTSLPGPFPGPCSMNRPDNIPINPNQGPNGPMTSTSSFDPISSLAQMSQQLTNTVGGGGPGPGGPMGPNGGNMGPFGSGPHHMQHHHSMHPHGHPHMMMNDLGCHMDNMGGPGMGGPMEGMMGGGDFPPDMNLSPKMGGGPMGGPMGPMGPDAAMMGPRMGGAGKMPPFNGANVQVKASAPNTIQYLPTRPQMPCNSGPRGPPSLDFLQRVTNPQMQMEGGKGGVPYFPGARAMDMEGSMRGVMRAPNMLRMPHHYPAGFNSPPKMPDPFGGPGPGPNPMCGPGFRGVKGGMGPGNVRMGSAQPLPPSMGGPGPGFKGQGFAVPSTADPTYAAQFHNFQQQLYATGSRAAQPHQTYPPYQPSK